MNASLILWIYIVLLLAGGLMGFIKAGSKASLIASSAFALPLILCATHVLNVRYLPEGILAFLLVFFGMRFAKSKKMMPNGVMAVLSLVALLLLVIR